MIADVSVPSRAQIRLRRRCIRNVLAPAALLNPATETRFVLVDAIPSRVRRADAGAAH
jgi:hypothetical protein